MGKSTAIAVDGNKVVRAADVLATFDRIGAELLEVDPQAGEKRLGEMRQALVGILGLTPETKT